MEYFLFHFYFGSQKRIWQKTKLNSKVRLIKIKKNVTYTYLYLPMEMYSLNSTYIYAQWKLRSGFSNVREPWRSLRCPPTVWCGQDSH